MTNEKNKSITSAETERRIPMTAEEKIALNERNIRQALADYGKHTYSQEVLEDVSNTFIKIVARDNYYAKQELRELFRKSPVWNEELDAIVINGTRTHEPDYDRVENLAYSITCSAEVDSRMLKYAIRFFTRPKVASSLRELYLESLNTLAPGAFVEGKKLSRVFRDFCKAIGVADDTKGSRFQQLYAQFADEIQSRQIPYKFFVSINPAHWLTMSNPKRDSRGTTLTSCHSFNSTEYSYNNGCSGYARDKYSFICFTVDDPNDAESLNNRKTSRQIFVYKPGSGVLLQSRLYNTSGGTYGAQAESKEYRDLIQRELSALEDTVNLWQTQKYLGQREIFFDPHKDFGGYTDWTYNDFVPMLSVRVNAAEPEGVVVGEAGVCIKCGCYNSDGVYCDNCKNDGVECDSCGGVWDEDDITWVYDRRGNRIPVCPRCLENYYRRCDWCGDYYDMDDMTYTEDNHYVCEDCLNDHYTQCYCCDEYVHNDDAVGAVDNDGHEVFVCSSCAENDFSYCDDCNTLVPNETLTTVYDNDGHESAVCSDCLSHYTRCNFCGEYHSDVTDGACSKCREEREAS